MHNFMTHRFKSYQLSNNIQYRLQIQPHYIYSHVIMVPYIQPLTNVSLIFTCAVRNNSGNLNYDRRKVHGTVFQCSNIPKKTCEYSNVLVKVLTGNVLLLHRKLTSSLHNRIKSPPGIVTSHLFLG